MFICVQPGTGGHHSGRIELFDDYRWPGTDRHSLMAAPAIAAAQTPGGFGAGVVGHVISQCFQLVSLPYLRASDPEYCTTYQ